MLPRFEMRRQIERPLHPVEQCDGQMLQVTRDGELRAGRLLLPALPKCNEVLEKARVEKGPGQFLTLSLKSSDLDLIEERD